MKVIKPQRLAVLTRTYEYEGRFYLAVNTMAFFTFGQPQRLLSEVSMWKFVATAMGKDAVLDMGMPKQRGEFLVYGKCHAPRAEPAAAVAVRVKVGAQEKKLLVLGDRRWKKIGPISTIGEPQPFTVMDLDYSKAFGGPDFPRNPLGKGMPPAQDGEPRLLPNIENPARPVALPDDRPEPAGMGPIDLTWPQRFSKVGTYDDHWLKTRFPGFCGRHGLVAVQRGGARPVAARIFSPVMKAFEVRWHAPADARAQKAQLPLCAVRCLVTQRAEWPVTPRVKIVPLRPETLMLFPGAAARHPDVPRRDGNRHRRRAPISRICSSARKTCGAAQAPLALPGHPGHPPRQEAGRPACAQRRAPACLAMPEPTGAGDAEDDAEEERHGGAGQVSKGLHRNNVRPQRRKDSSMKSKQKPDEDARGTGRDRIQRHGLAPPDLDRSWTAAWPWPCRPDPPVPPTLEELPAFQAEMSKVMEKAKSDGQALRSQAEAQLRQSLQATEARLRRGRRLGQAPGQRAAQADCTDKTMNQLLRHAGPAGGAQRVQP
jgi:hypothetical protein